MKNTLPILIFLLLINEGFSQGDYKTLHLEGQAKIKQKGYCEMITAPFDVKLFLKINNETGEITGEEYIREIGEKEFEKNNISNWYGEFIKPDILRLKTETKFTCQNDGQIKSRTEILNYIAVLKHCENGLNETCLELEEIYAMCPKSGCIFKIKYDLKVLPN